VQDFPASQFYQPGDPATPNQLPS